MADSKITALTSIGASTDPANDPLVLVDVSDTSMAATGTTKKVTLNQLLGASGTATLASATISGDLTVDTSTLKVDSANNRVGIGTATPDNQLSVRAASIATIDVRGGVGGAGALLISGNGTTLGTTSFDLIQNSAGAFVYQRDALPLFLYVNGSERYAISSTGVATWSNVGGVAGTAMTLNSTGLGVGGSPLASHLIYSQGPVAIAGTASGARTSYISNANACSIYYTDGGATYPFDNFGNLIIQPRTSAARSVIIATGSTTPVERLIVDPTGNVGVGVTPSAWNSSYKAIEFGSGNALMSSSSGYGQAFYLNNAVYNTSGNYVYKNTQAAGMYQQNQGAHQWYNAPSGTAGNAITFTQAMTLDASGNLLVGDTSSPLASRLSLFTTFAQPDGIVIRNTGATAGLYWRFGAVNTSNTLFVMNASNVGVTMADGASAWSATSDERLKDIIEPIKNAVSKVGSLRSVIGKYKSDADGIRRSFLIAQDVKSVLPEAVDSTDSESLGLRYTEVIPLLVAAIKELTARIEALEA